jgi:TonB-linked SusC/RagA family outer membrane protein
MQKNAEERVKLRAAGSAFFMSNYFVTLFVKLIFKTCLKNMNVLSFKSMIFRKCSAIVGVFLMSVAVASAQTGVVTGVVTDNSGESLIGVNVSVKGTTNGAITDIDGKFSIQNVAGRATLVASYVGYVTQEIAVNNRTNINIKLVEATREVDEVVVVGYGVQRKSDLTGSITKVDAEDFKNVPVTGVEMALQGRAAGVMIMSQSGAPGSGTSVRVRGVGTVNNANDPLYVVDGIPVSDINYLNPSDIASIEILKDASATAIYGSRASNGVVLITTIRGNNDSDFKTEVKFDAYYGIQQAMNLPEVYGADGFVTMNQIAYRNNPDGFNKDFRDKEAFLSVVQKVTGSREGTDWIKEVFQTGSIQNYNINVRGGNRKISYLTSASYFDNVGTIIYSGFKRMTLRANVDFNISDRVKLTTNVSVTSADRRTILENDLENGVVFGAITYDPTAPVYRAGYQGLAGWEDRLIGYDPNNMYSLFGTSKYSNKSQPYATAYRYGNLRNEGMLRLIGNAVLDIKLFPWLIFKSNIGTDMNGINNNEFTPQYYLDPDEKSDNSTLMKRRRDNTSWTFENTLNFTRKFDSHSLSAVAGVTLEAWDNTDFRASRQGLPNNNEDQWVLDAGTFNQTNQGSRSHRSMMSYLGRVNYVYADRYLVTASIRADGSSKFSKEHRWSSFPSVSLGWRISQEKFFQDWKQEIISNLKLRLGWGQIGNQMGLGNNDFMNTITGNNDKKYVFGQNKTQYTGYSPNTMGNPNIQWETSEQTNAGIDFSLLGGAINGTLDYYIKDTRDMLLQVPLPRSLGYQNDPWANLGKVRNQGFEMQLTWIKKASKDFSFVLTGNLSTIKNEVIDIGGRPMPGGNERIGDVTLTKEGWPIGTFYGWQVEGIFQSQAEIDASHMVDRRPRPGDLIFKDVDGDGKLTDYDRVNLGNPFPKVGYGLNFTAQYKNFDLAMFFQGQAGNKIFRMFKYYTHQKTGFFNTYNDMIDISWRAPGTLGPNDPGVASNTEFAFNSDPLLNIKASSYYVEDGSYVRMKNIQIGYNLPKKMLQKAFIKSLRVYVGAYNLLTITKYQGIDPEMAGNGNGDPRNFGIDRSIYPQPQSYMAGLTLTL